MSNLMPNGTQHYRGRNLICIVLVISVFLGSIVMIQGISVECGTVNSYREHIIDGDAVLREQWPFIAALYYSKSFKYFCGGTIISNQHVLTAANCMHRKLSNFMRSRAEITVRLGAYNLTASSESGVVNRNVTQIHIHPDWDAFEGRFDADIAVLVLSETVTFSTNIRPVCMPTDYLNIEKVEGMVVGWSITEKRTVDGIPWQARIFALDDWLCERDFESVIPKKPFCGVGNGTTNYRGHPGDGFFVATGSAWFQYATVSIVKTNASGHVDPKAFVVYTELTSFKHWIADTVSRSGSLVSVATMKINLQCDYGYVSSGTYGCWPLDLNIRETNFFVFSITGSHKLNKEDKDVELIVFEGGVMFFLPDNFGNIFKNVKCLIVKTYMKRIFRSNLQSLERLEDIKFLNNEIEELNEDSLWDLPKLKTFQLEKSKLKSLNAATFSKNLNLTTVYVLYSVLQTLPRNLFENNLLLESVKFDRNFIESVDDKTFDQNANLKLVSLKWNRLKCLSSNLFRKNFELETVDFSYNAIRTIGEQTFQSNSKLKRLSLESNLLEYLPSAILQGKPSLEEINLSNNSLKSIDERFFESNVNVSEIHLWSNQLDTLPSNLFHKNLLLLVVDLGKNSLETIDEKLFETNTLLRNISLKSNRLDELPGHLFEKKWDLEFVNVRKNFLDAIAEHTFETNAKLLEVYFGGNYLTFVPPKLFKNNFLLQTVDFANNYLVVIDERLFQMNPDLRNLNLSSNLLGSLPTNLFRNNSLLEIVDLSKNMVDTIDENIFTTSPKLKEVFLQSNQLQTLPRNLFRNNTVLKHIDLRGNQLKVIEIAFIKFKGAFSINLYNNICIDAVFYNVDDRDSKRFDNRFQNLAELQNIINANCH